MIGTGLFLLCLSMLLLNVSNIWCSICWSMYNVDMSKFQVQLSQVESAICNDPEVSNLCGHKNVDILDFLSETDSSPGVVISILVILTFYLLAIQERKWHSEMTSGFPSTSKLWHFIFRSSSGHLFLIRMLVIKLGHDVAMCTQRGLGLLRVELFW